MTGTPGSGLARGLAITFRAMTRRAHTRQYPDHPPELPPRSRGVIALFEENCTVCMLCARECPDWCIYIDSHKESVQVEGAARARQRNVLDRFAIDFSLCMYCGICVEVCPFDALFWSPEFEYAEYDIRDMTHEKERLREWMWTVPPPPALDPLAEPAKEVVAVEKAREKAAETPDAGAKPAAADKAEKPDAGGKPAAAGKSDAGEKGEAAEKSERPARSPRAAKAAAEKAEKADAGEKPGEGRRAGAGEKAGAAGKSADAAPSAQAAKAAEGAAKAAQDAAKAAEGAAQAAQDAAKAAEAAGTAEAAGGKPDTSEAESKPRGKAADQAAKADAGEQGKAAEKPEGKPKADETPKAEGKPKADEAPKADDHSHPGSASAIRTRRGERESGPGRPVRADNAGSRPDNGSETGSETTAKTPGAPGEGPA